MKRKNLPPVHPGEILKEEFMVSLSLSANQLALQLRIPTGRITQIINGQRAVTADTALRLSRYFGTSAQFWLGLQVQYEIECAEDKLDFSSINEIKPLKRAN